MNERRRKNIIIGVLCSLLVAMGVGYAALSQVLIINSTATVTGKFDIHFLTGDANRKGISVQATSVTDKQTQMENAALVDSNDNTLAHFAAVLHKPSDYVTYKVIVKNYGTIKGKLGTIGVNTSASTELSTWLSQNGGDWDDYFEVDHTADENTVINPGGEYDFTVTVTFKNGATKLPQGALNSVITLGYVQDDGQQSGGNNSEVCYTPLNEAKQLRKITSTGESLGTATSSNLSVGDLVGFGTSDISSNEQFYVLENNNGTLKLLSRYLINVSYTDSNNKNHQKPWDNCSRDTRGLQDGSIGVTRANVNEMPDTSGVEAEFNARGYLYGTLPFSSTNYWWDSTGRTYASGYNANSFVYNSSSTLKTYVDSYASTLSTMGLTGATGTVLSIQELETICNNTNFSTSDVSGCPSYIFEAQYWVGSAYIGNVWDVDAYGDVGITDFDDDTCIGVRPVINVTVS